MGKWLFYDKSAFDFSEDDKKTLYAKGTLCLLYESCPLSEQSSMPHWAKQPIDAALVVSALGSVTALMKELYEAVEESRTPDFKRAIATLDPASSLPHVPGIYIQWIILGGILFFYTGEAFDIAVHSLHPSSV